ncbi:MAG: hypothetical protein ACJ8F7_02100 [Gemmataceae bacterium]
MIRPVLPTVFALAWLVAAASAQNLDSAGSLPEGALFRFGTTRYRQPLPVEHSALSPDDRTLVTTSPRGGLFGWDLKTGQPAFRQFYSGIDAHTPVAVSPDGNFILAGGLFRQHPDGRLLVQSARIGWRDLMWWTRDGEVAGLAGTSVQYWDPQTGDKVREVALGRAFPWLVAVADGLLVGWEPGGAEGELVAFDLQRRREVARFSAIDVSGNDFHGAIAPGGRALAVALDRNKGVRLWDLDRPGVRETLSFPATAGSDPVTALAWSADGRQLVAGTRSGRIELYDLAGHSHKPLNAHVRAVKGIHFTKNAQTLVSVSEDGRMRRWDVAAGRELPEPAGYAAALRTAFSADGRRIAIADDEGRVDVWDTGTGEKLFTPVGPDRVARHVAFLPDGQMLLTASAAGNLRAWNIAGVEVRAATLPGLIDTLTVSPDGRMLFAGNADAVWRADVVGGQPAWRVPAGRVGSSPLRVSPDGRTLAFEERPGSGNGWRERILLVDTDSGATRQALEFTRRGFEFTGYHHEGRATFLPGARKLLTSHDDGTLRVWDLASGREEPRLNDRRALVTVHDLSPDGHWVAAGTDDGSIRVWELDTGQQVYRLPGHAGPVRDVRFSPDGRRLLSWGVDSVAYLWKLQPQSAGVDIAALWGRLGSPDGAEAYAAVWAFADDPKSTCAFFRGRLRPARPLTADEAARLIADLGSAQFAAREAAMKALRDAGPAALEPIEAALAKPQPAEATRRLRELRRDWQQGTAATVLQQVRAVRVLELCHTPEARELLQSWADGDPAARLTVEAGAALRYTFAAVAKPVGSASSP